MAGATRAVFLSYRRGETRHIAGRLADRLTDRLGSEQVFMDVDAIDPGADFTVAIAREVASCRVLIAVIGPSWSRITDQRGRRRIDDPDDFVVLEIRAALERGIHVIPVLVDGAVMPDRGDLPEGLQALARRNAVRLDHDTFRSDITTVLNAIDRILSTPAQQATEPTVGTDADAAAGAVATPVESPQWTVEPESRWVLERIDEFQERLKGRARQADVDLARIDYDAIGEPDGAVTTKELIDSLRKAGKFSYDQIVRIGKPAHLAKLSDSDLSLFIERAMQRHSDARGATNQSVSYQAHQLHMIRNAYAELRARIQPGRV